MISFLLFLKHTQNRYNFPQNTLLLFIKIKKSHKRGQICLRSLYLLCMSYQTIKKSWKQNMSSTIPNLKGILK